MPENVTENATEVVQLRNAFYRDNYQRVLMAMLIMLFACVALIFIVFFQLTHRPTPQYFAISSDGKDSQERKS